MKFLLINQAFHPDVVATAQYLSSLAQALVEAGHDVEVIASRRAYDRPQEQFPARQDWRGVRIRRVFTTAFGKGAKWRRAADFASFMLSCCARLLVARRPDVVIALTSPPLISFLAACFAAVRRCRFVYWVMDLNPDEAIAAGWLRSDSITARLLDRLSIFSLRRADPVIVLDRFMQERVLAKGIDPERVRVLPPWSQDDAVEFDAAGREMFRRAHGLEEKFVVMYSGNHSPCHPLTTLLEAAARMDGEDVTFCFVGGGSEFARVQTFVREKRLSNVLCLPYQPFDRLAASLSAADLHVVVMGTPFVGTIHPCKIYNVLRVAAPVLYIGPALSHATEILQAAGTAHWSASVPHGDVDGVVRAIRECRARGGGERCVPSLCEKFGRTRILPRMLAALEGTRRSETSGQRAVISNQ